MDLQAILEKVEADFFRQLDKEDNWGLPHIVTAAIKEDVKKEFNTAVRNVLVVTYARVMKDAKEA